MSLPTFTALGPEGFGKYAVDLKTMVMEASDRPAEGLLVPGFVDIHIHGAFGHDFMSGTAEDLLAMADGLQKVGYEAFLPTTVTGSLEDVRRAVSLLPDNDWRVQGLHLEGPFISPKHPGAQPHKYIVEPSAEWDGVLDHRRLRLVTLAPEIPGGLELTKRLSDRLDPVIVSLGHTDATYDQVQAAVEAGASHTTHTYNAMRPLHHREPGTVGAAMTLEKITCELIYDRIHVSRPAAEVVLRCKGADGVIAVSDATMAAGMEPGTEISMWGLDCVVGDKQVRLKNGTLAGSGITLYDAFQNLVHDFGPEVAIRLCCLNPRRALKMGSPRVWTIMDPELRIQEIIA
ncbi:N-acetylglucosamine-6-phosphate deacetylase [bacterium]|nr:MAG: N-acetylglucosamine-6-phosphate deacetylase [bacterium]